MSDMTILEKCEYLAQQNGTVGKNDRLEMTGITPLDNPRGGDDYYRLPLEAQSQDYHPVCFPSMTNLGMTWNRAAAEETASYMGKECKGRTDIVRWMFRPGMNIKRSPLCGRNFEYASEDPILTGQIAGHYIKGLQSEGIAACAKHYAVNHQEYQRMTTNSVVSERALKEVYLKVFEEAFTIEKPWTLMTSYNKVNGSYVNSSSMLMNYLRNDLKYDGVVVSDWAAIHRDKTQAHATGMDVETLASDCHSKDLERAVLEQKVDEACLDRSVERVQALVELCENTKYEEIDMELLHVKSIDLAADSIALLKNQNQTLPYQSEQKILVAGQLAASPLIMGYGSGGMNGYWVESPLECMKKSAGKNITFAKGYEQTETIPYLYNENPQFVEEAVTAASDVDQIVVFAGYFYGHETEGRDRQELTLPKSQENLIRALIETKTPVTLVISAGSAVDISEFEKELSAVIYAGYAGEGFGKAITDILFGMREPGGRLAETFPKKLEDTPAYLSFTMEDEENPNVYYGEDIFVGYRYYEKKKMEVLYPFGHGLSYTDFAYELKESKLEDSKIILKVGVKNTGNRAGSAVIQCYTGKSDSKMKRPVKELKTFEKVTLEAGEVMIVALEISLDKLKVFSESQSGWILESGCYQIYLGTSLTEIFAETEVVVESTDRARVYDRMTPLVDFIHNEAFMALMAKAAPEAVGLLDQRMNPHLPLLWALPIERFREPLDGQQIFTNEMIDQIIAFCNQ
ncbi:MAG: glycoside hydrolase family 3 C-terminal domain-containing protein [Eubacteriales bacterium]|nr:glycoside hydrolase family 3 C-terminal domain-containing protein [Eubacteriales bacterium]